MRDLQPKKSEKIEVRLDHETKLALQAKASSEGLSVSDALRGLIARYVSDAASSSFIERRNIMRLSTIAGGVAAALIAAVSIAGTAHARDVTLGVVTQIIASPVAGPLPQLNGPPQTSVELDYDTPTLLCVPKAQGAAPRIVAGDGTCRFDAAGGYTMLLWAQRGDDKAVMIGLRRLYGDEASPRGMVGSVMAVAPGEPAGMWSSQRGEQAVLGVGLTVDRP